MHIEPLNPAIGARVGGLRLHAALTDAECEQLLAALLRHHVLFFEGQDLDPVTQRAVAARFGRLHIHPIYPHVPGVPEIIVLDTSHDNPPDNDNWHTDVTFLAEPAMGALLAAKVLPPSGGDTLWASGIAAWNALSHPWQQMLAGLHAEHDILKSFPAWRFARTPEEKRRWDQARADHPPRLHPVVRTHPVSGLQGLFVNEGFTTRIAELQPSESEAVLRQLFAHVSKPEFTVRWRWKLGDVAFWDNRLTQHYATADYLPARRVMHRATVMGDAPFYRPG
jgi:taurine dioxygenase